MFSSCSRGDSHAEIDLLQLLPSAERRAAGRVDDAIRIGAVATGNGEDAALFLRAPARVTWTLRIPARAALTATARIVEGQGATLRVGFSDNRSYDGIYKLELTAGAAWQPVTVDLRRYGGWQWSLFYRPWEITWHVILNADATPGGVVALRRPIIHN